MSPTRAWPLASGAIAVLGLVSACSHEDYRNADLQLDILAPLPSAAERVRICVEGARSRTAGAGGERYALPGLTVGQDAPVTVDVLVVDPATQDDTALVSLITIARSRAVTLTSDQPYLSTELDVYADSADDAMACSDCPQACGTVIDAADPEDESWLLTARFQD